MHLVPNDILETLYLTQLENLVDEINCDEHPLFEMVNNFNGIYHEFPNKTFVIYIKIFTDSNLTCNIFLTKISKLIQIGWLTYYDYKEETPIKDPIAIILTKELRKQIPIEDMITEKANSFYGD